MLTVWGVVLFSEACGISFVVCLGHSLTPGKQPVYLFSPTLQFNQSHSDVNAIWDIFGYLNCGKKYLKLHANLYIFFRIEAIRICWCARPRQ